MIKVLKRIVFAAAALAMMIQAACSDASRQPEVLASAPLPMDKAGASATVDFTLTKAHIALDPHFMLALNFPQTQEMKVEDLMHDKGVLVKVEIVQLQGAQGHPIRTQDYAAYRNDNWQNGQVPSRLHLYATNGRTSYVLIAGFYPPGPGQYRATITTLENQPLLSGIDSEIKVEHYYNMGE